MHSFIGRSDRYNDGLKRDGGDWDSFAGSLPLLKQVESLTLLDANFTPWSWRDHYKNLETHEAIYKEKNLATQGFFDGASQPSCVSAAWRYWTCRGTGI